METASTQGLRHQIRTPNPGCRKSPLQGRGSAAAQSLPGRHVVPAIYAGLTPRATLPSCLSSSWGESQTLPDSQQGGVGASPLPRVPCSLCAGGAEAAAALSFAVGGGAPARRLAPLLPDPTLPSSACFPHDDPQPPRPPSSRNSVQNLLPLFAPSLPTPLPPALLPRLPRRPSPAMPTPPEPLPLSLAPFPDPRALSSPGSAVFP